MLTSWGGPSGSALVGWGCLLQLLLTLNGVSALSRPVPRAAPLPLHHPVQQACGQQARAADACLPHAASPLPPRHSAHHHQLGAPGASEDPQALEPELPATRTPSPALSCSLLQGGEP